MEFLLPHGYWRDTFPNHLIGMERELEFFSFQFSAEIIVYLAGMVARQLDKDYKKDSQIFLLETPQKMEELIQKHILYIGQNAIIVTYSKINAEHLACNLALSIDSNFSKNFELKQIVRLFHIASTFSYYSGNQLLGSIFNRISRNFLYILKFLESYLTKLNGKLPEFTPLSKSIWTRFEKERNLSKLLEHSQATVQIEKLMQHPSN